MLLAHSSHWLVNLLYFFPVIGFLGWLALTTIRERRRGGDPDAPPPRNRAERRREDKGGRP